ncbi:TIGR04282 family arsenosugar biosynthesis glycosyltransferase [uncultured Polaribacter sp.]|uniref:TIGR04282 family arsenosugar biosynthesis glycosyltransferase n=1 Tax=uncultured Polaribacter sp. TaxID=174711 RepID=UPI002624FECC|nr:TIGR04282 family arsenosugar biosynthesis glycosyltransferase [uncultured Polaribacter sp.]
MNKGIKKMTKNHKNLLLVFTRNPELGKAKTRLAKTVGDQKALEIYKFLLDRTRTIASQVNADKAVYYSVKIRENDLWDASIFQKHQQIGEDLGIRMQNAFHNGFKAGYDKVLIIGSDLYDLTPETVNHAFHQLDTNDVVIGPAEDGGYYLLGMNRLHENVFQNKDWGTETVRAATLKDLQDKKVHLLHELNDVDVYEDIAHHPAFQHLL